MCQLPMGFPTSHRKCRRNIHSCQQSARQRATALNKLQEEQEIKLDILKRKLFEKMEDSL